MKEKSHHRQRKENRVVGKMLEEPRFYMGDPSDKKNVRNYLSGEYIHENKKQYVPTVRLKEELKKLEQDRKLVAQNQRERNIARLETIFFQKRPKTKLQIIWDKIKLNWNKVTALFVNNK